MEVDFVDIKRKKGDSYATVVCGEFNNDKRIINVTFDIDLSKLDINNYEQFGEKVINMENSTLFLGNDVIRFNWKESSVLFALKKFNIKLANHFAPECLREQLAEGFYEDDSVSG